MTREVLVRRCQGWEVAPRPTSDEVVQCEQPATQDGAHCPFHWDQRPRIWMLVKIDD